MKKLLLAGILLASPAYAESVCPVNKICPTCKPTCYEHVTADPCYKWSERWQSWARICPDPPKVKEEAQYEYSEATLWNAPPWMKLNCHRREHRWARYRHQDTMCR
jgi:hypothetical protein